MTIKLLAPYGRAPANAIVTLDAATEAGLVTAKQATTDLSYGQTWVDPYTVTTRPTSAVLADPAGVLTIALPTLSGVVPGVFIGDSFTTRGNANVSITSASRVNNWVTIVTSGNHGMGTGQIGTICNMDVSSFNAANARVTVLSATSLTYYAPGPDGSAGNLDGLSNGSTQKPRTLINRSSRADNGFFNRLAHESAGGISVLHNGGAPGQTTADMRARFLAEVTPFKGLGKLLVLQAGYNNFALFHLSADDAYADMAWMADQGLQLGFLVEIVNCAPWATGGTAADRAEAARYNSLLRRLGMSQAGIKVADVCSALIDATNATGMYPQANMLETAGVHMMPKGTRSYARAMWTPIAPYFTSPPSLVSSSVDHRGANAASKNLLRYGPWAATGGGVNSPVTGTCPGGYTCFASGSGTFAVAAVARSDGAGYDLQATITSGSAADQFIVNLQGDIAATDYAPGDKIRVSHQLTLSGTNGANLKGILEGLFFKNGTYNPQPYISTVTATSAAEFGATDETILVFSEDIVVPSDGASTGYNFQLVFVFAGAGTALIAKYGRARHDLVN